MTLYVNQLSGVSVFGATGGGGGGGTPGGSDGQLQYNASGSFGGMAGTSWDNTNRALTLTGATVTTSQPVLNLSQTWNAAGVTFTGMVFNVTNTASASTSLLMDLQVGGATQLRVDATGIIERTGTVVLRPIGSNSYGFSTSGFSLGNNTRVLQFGSSADLTLSRPAAATLQMGAADAASPVAQTLQVQSVVAGTTNTAGTNFTIKGSAGTGTGAGGSIIFQVAPAGSSGTAQNAYATALTIAGNRAVTAAFTFSAAAVNVGDATALASTGVLLNSSSPLSWSSDAFYYGTADVFLRRDAANTLALRNGTNAQTFSVYNTYTDASNYERGRISWVSNVLTIGTEKAGSGTARALELQTDGVTRLTINTSGNASFSGAVVVGSASNFGWSGRSIMSSPSAGVIYLRNNTETDFNRLQFGGTTSSFPALKRDSASLICRLADDSANAAFEALSLKTDAPAGGTSGTWKLGVAATVSPTSPNRTIEVDIGGTIYYIAAKTTND